MSAPAPVPARRHRHRAVALAVLGALVAAALGGALMGAVTDAVRVQDNTLESTEFELHHDIKLAFYDHDAQRCPDPESDPSELFSDGPVLGFDLEVDLAFEDPHVLSPIYCVYNLGPRTGTLRLVIDPDSVQEIDVACSPGEEEFGGDDTCGGDQEGELSSVLIDEIARGASITDPPGSGIVADAIIPEGSRGVCSSGRSRTGLPVRLTGQPNTIRSGFEPGEFCTIRIQHPLGVFVEGTGIQEPTLEQLAAAQTDRLIYDRYFVLED